MVRLAEPPEDCFTFVYIKPMAVALTTVHLQNIGSGNELNGYGFGFETHVNDKPDQKIWMITGLHVVTRAEGMYVETPGQQDAVAYAKAKVAARQVAGNKKPVVIQFHTQGSNGCTPSAGDNDDIYDRLGSMPIGSKFVAGIATGMEWQVTWYVKQSEKEYGYYRVTPWLHIVEGEEQSFLKIGRDTSVKFDITKPPVKPYQYTNFANGYMGYWGGHLGEPVTPPYRGTTKPVVTTGTHIPDGDYADYNHQVPVSVVEQAFLWIEQALTSEHPNSIVYGPKDEIEFLFGGMHQTVVQLINVAIGNYNANPKKARYVPMIHHEHVLCPPYSYELGNLIAKAMEKRGIGIWLDMPEDDPTLAKIAEEVRTLQENGVSPEAIVGYVLQYTYNMRVHQKLSSGLYDHPDKLPQVLPEMEKKTRFDRGYRAINLATLKERPAEYSDIISYSNTDKPNKAYVMPAWGMGNTFTNRVSAYMQSYIKYCLTQGETNGNNSNTSNTDAAPLTSDAGSGAEPAT